MPLIWLAAGLFLVQHMRQRRHVASNAAATELFPTPLRGTMIGWFALVSAIGAVISNAAVAVLAQRNGRVIDSGRRNVDSRNSRRDPVRT